MSTYTTITVTDEDIEALNRVNEAEFRGEASHRRVLEHLISEYDENQSDDGTVLLDDEQYEALLGAMQSMESIDFGREHTKVTSDESRGSTDGDIPYGRTD